MIISNSQIGMESAGKYSSVRMDMYSYSSSASAVSLNGKANTKEVGDTEDNGKGKVTDYADSFRDSLSSLRDRFEQMRSNSSRSAAKIEQDAINRIRTECINFLLRLLFGRGIVGDNSQYELSEINSSEESEGSTNQTLGFTRIGIEESHYYSESESADFSATGKVVTSDGREIEFGLDLSMTRRFEETTKISRAEIATVLCDPLVINIDSPIAEVSDQKITFDIDADGVEDKISSLGRGSGYLSLDKNGDGVINDGSELFGTASGDGFRDLSKYDLDGNGWIDEADDVFDKLKICCMDENGKQTLYSLKEKGVGAIYLGSAATNFSLTDIANNANAVIRKTGIFLYENGSAGTIQHVDMAKEMMA